MVLPSKLYEILKFVVKFVPLLVTFVSTTLLAIGVSEPTALLVTTIIGAIGTLIEGTIEICKANHYKLSNGTVLSEGDEA